MAQMRTLLLGLIGPTLAFVSVPALAQVQPGPQRIVGYYTSWSIYARNYHVPDIPAERVTHINYAFANLQNGLIVLGDPYADIDRFYPGDCWDPGCLRGAFHQLQIKKQQHPHLKTLISIGGWTWSGGFSDAVLTAASRQAFATSIVDFVVLYEFDGADVDWEYPVSGGLASNVTRPEDKQNYTLFLAELRQQLDARSQITGKDYLLTIAAPCNPAVIDNYEVELIHPLLDWINLMSYDLHGPWGDPVTGHNAPIYADPQDPSPEPMRSTFNTANAVDIYLARGVPSDKLHIGMPFYGRGFAGVQGGNQGEYGTYTSPSSPGTWQNGVHDYYDLAANYVNVNGYTRHWNDTSRVPWLHNASQGVFISYDDERSIREKAWFAQANDLGGAMFWEFSGDRNHELLAVVDTVMRQQPALRMPVREVSASSPVSVDLKFEGQDGRGGRIYALIASMSGTWPGWPLAGDVLPLNEDWLSTASLQSANGSLFQQNIGMLDPNGTATATINLAGVAPLPPALVGLRINLAGWVFAAPGALQGEPTNAVDLFIGS